MNSYGLNLKYCVTRRRQGVFFICYKHFDRCILDRFKEDSKTIPWRIVPFGRRANLGVCSLQFEVRQGAHQSSFPKLCNRKGRSAAKIYELRVKLLNETFLEFRVYYRNS